MSEYKDYPSIKLAYDWVRAVLTEQGQIAASHDNKSAVLWAVATAIIGVGIPIGINKAFMLLNHGLYIMIATLVIYVLATITAIIALFPRRVETMKHPKALRDRYAVLPEEYFVEYLYQDIEQGFSENDKIVKLKGWSGFLLFILTFVEALLIVSWFVYAFTSLS